MRRDELNELHYITPMTNLPSILERGILSNRLVADLPHESVAMGEIQERRDIVRVPGGRWLHEYANLYFHARNPMMYKRQVQHAALCILRISPKVIELPKVVITDGNASSAYVRFAAAPAGLAIVDHERTYAESWNHPEQIEKWRRASAKCAEVLVPDRVDPRYLTGAYVSCAEAQSRLVERTPDLAVVINGHLFFR